MYNNTMTIYGSGRERKKSKAKFEEPIEIERPDTDFSSPYHELCKFADEFRLHVELDKPFIEFKQMRLNIYDGDELVKSVTLEGLDQLDSLAATVLNDLGKDYS
jgi:hypothetical protein